MSSSAWASLCSRRNVSSARGRGSVLTEISSSQPRVPSAPTISRDQFCTVLAQWQSPMAGECEAIYGDFGFGLGLPLALRRLSTLERLARVLLPILGRLPLRWLYPLGEAQEKIIPRFENWYNWATVLADDFHYVKRHLPARLDGKIVVDTVVPLKKITPFVPAAGSALQEAQPREGAFEVYPGSPWWLARRLRSRDRVVLFELHPGEHRHLEGQVLPENVRRVHGDGLKGLLQRLPVSTPRLCGLIDPSFERKAEYAEVAETLLAAMRKVRHAVMLVGYPLLPAGRHRELLEGLRDGGLRKIWCSELTLREPATDERGMYGSGMLVVNPPWGVDERLGAAMAGVTPRLGAACRYHSGWWVEE